MTERQFTWRKCIIVSISIGLAWLLPSVFAMAQEREVLPVDERCIVTVLNRAVYADEDGTFVLPNVPATQGNIKAKVTCFWDEGIVSAESDYFALVNGGVTDVIQFYRGSLEPVPVELYFTHTTSTLNSSDVLIEAANETFQVLVEARYSDDSTAVVTSVPGMNYASSTPAVATINGLGIIAAHSSGSSLVTVRKDGVLSAFFVNVITSGDSDADGMPDDFEVANGLNPNDPIDAFEDQDRDGLNALAEFGLGTDVNIPDTDNDGIEDGEEVFLGEDGFITNPLLVDTDGDGVSDSLEIASGSDPTNSDSVNLSEILFDIDATTILQQIFINEVDSEARHSVIVTGTLIDGATIDLTSRSGTTYTSSDFSRCSFGSIKAEVIFTAPGTCVVSAGYSGTDLVDSVAYSVAIYVPVEIVRVDIASRANDIEVNGVALYMLTDNELQLFNIVQAASPVLVGSVSTGGGDLFLSGDLLYLAAEDGIYVYDVSAPLTPVLLGFSNVSPGALDLVEESGYLYLSDTDGRIKILDVSNPGSISLVSDTAVGSGTILSLDVDSALGMLVFFSEDQGFGILDLANPLLPSLVSSNYLPEIVSHKIIIDEYVVYASFLDGGVVTFDISDPLNPLELDRTQQANAGHDVSTLSKQDGLIFNAGIYFWSFVAILNGEVADSLSINSLLFFENPDNSLTVNTLSTDTESAYFTTESYLAIWRYRYFLDTDGDGLSDRFEELIGTSPDFQDTDNDTLADGYEYGVGLDPMVFNDLAEDNDGDGLTLGEEFSLGSNPFLVDSDGDTLTDGEEVTLGTNPINSDTDGDGLSDSYEVDNGYDPLDASDPLTGDGDIDTDGDGYPDYIEVLAGSNSLEASSTPVPGTLLWSVSNAAVVGDGGYAWAPALDDEHNLYMTGSCWAYAFDRAGALLWDTVRSGPGCSGLEAAPIVDSDMLYLQNSWNSVLGGSVVRAHDRLSGVLVWEYVLDNSSNSNSMVLGNNNDIIAVDTSGVVHSINKNGTLNWRSPVSSNAINGAPVVSLDGTIYVTSGSVVYALDPLNGSVLWGNDTGDYFDSSQPALDAQGRLYAQSSDNIYAFSLDGELRWKFPVTQGYSSPVIDAEGVLYSLSGNSLFAVNYDGSEKWRYMSTAGSLYFSSLIIGKNGDIYVWDAAANLIAIDGTIGGELWRTDTAGTGNSSAPTLDSQGVLYGVDDSGVAYAFITASGGVANSPWPMGGYDIYNSGRQCSDFVSDADGDGMPDCYETLSGFDVNNSADGVGDTDGDGLTNVEEYLAGTHPRQIDTDGDSLSDYDEIQLGISPTNRDSDSDGIDDNIEIFYGLNPAINDSLLDSDGDSYKNALEIHMGYDPTDSNSNPVIGELFWSAQPHVASGNHGGIALDSDGAVHALTHLRTSRYSYYYQVVMSRMGELRTSMYQGSNSSSSAKTTPVIGGDRFSMATWGKGPIRSYIGTSVAWEFGSSCSVARDPLVDSNNVSFFTDNCGELNSVSEVGDLLWSQSFTSSMMPFEMGMSLDGRIVASDNRGDIRGINDSDGSIAWTYDSGQGSRYGLPAIDAQGNAYLINSSGDIAALNRDGVLLWANNSEFTSAAEVSPIISESGQVLFSGFDSTGAHVVAFDKFGERLWRYTLGAQTGTSVGGAMVAGEGGITFVVSQNPSAISALDSAGGLLWSQGTGLDSLSTRSRTTLSQDGLLYAIDQSGTIASMLVSTGGAALSPWPMSAANPQNTGVQCQVAISLDSDSDGLPDCYERMVGMNSSDPSDAGLDFDLDGLTNLQEYTYYSDINLADSDGDGKTDGEEVLAGTRANDPAD